MKNILRTCDVEDLEHKGDIKAIMVRVIFDHDQEDGLSKTEPYFSTLTLDMCESCIKYMFENFRCLYGVVAMGYNKYYLTNK